MYTGFKLFPPRCVVIWFGVADLRGFKGFTVDLRGLQVDLMEFKAAL